MGHATNARLLDEVKGKMPWLSATSVHRITSRLSDDGIIGATQLHCNGSIILDANPAPHHHFFCNCCNTLHDIELPGQTVDNLKQQIGHDIAESLTINGTCNKCKETNV